MLIAVFLMMLAVSPLLIIGLVLTMAIAVCGLLGFRVRNYVVVSLSTLLFIIMMRGMLTMLFF